MKKAAVAAHMSLTFSQAKNIKLLTIFGAIAAFVPPPFGFVTATILVGGYAAGSYAGRRLSRSFREAMGYAQPGDFEILGIFNHIQNEGIRKMVPLASVQKTVFPGAEIR